jgi:hypothetical protein
MSMIRVRSTAGLGFGPMPAAFSPTTRDLPQRQSVITSDATRAVASALRAQGGTSISRRIPRKGQSSSAQRTTSVFGPPKTDRPRTPQQQAAIEQQAAQERVAAQNLETELDFQQETTEANVDQDSGNADSNIVTDDTTGGDIVDDGNVLAPCPAGQARNAAQVCVPIVQARPATGMSTGAKVAIAGGVGLVAVGLFFAFR